MEDEYSKILLCYNRKYSIADYNKDCKEGNKKRIANFIYNRFSERYIEPFEDNERKNGFCIMAVSCLMIEALESFWQGFEDTQGKSKKCFKDFFSHCDQLKDFRGLEEDFYEHIRCGILHQAETRSGWRISRRDEDTLLDRNTKIINATKFLRQLKNYLLKYKEILEKSDFTSDVWKNFRKKMDAIIKNCQV